VAVSSRDEAEIRVGFMQGDGSWSYLGRQILDRGVNERTMNFGWDLLRAPREKTEWNILRKIEPDTVQGSNWDPDSIMEYPFPAGLILVLFERDGGELRYQAGDEDSGEDRNATLQLKLFQGREYVVRVRLYFSQGSGETAVMLW
jgi:hypothetical protein